VRTLLLLCAAAVATAAAESEVLREEAYNYRVVGALPKGWARQSGRRHWTYAIDKIPHAHVQFARQRVNGSLDIKKELRRREVQYKFPGSPKDARGTIRKATWGGREAHVYEFRTTIRDIECLRRVTVLFDRPRWYELIETVYGKDTEQRCAEGLAVFRDGFRLLVRPLAEAAKTDTAERTLESVEYGYRILKPENFLLVDIDTGAAPGVRVRFERAAAQNRHARVRLFEHGVRRIAHPERWFDVFYSSFAAGHMGASKEKLEAPPAIPGASRVWGYAFEGRREGLRIRTSVLLIHAKNGRVFVLRVREQADLTKALREALDRVVASLEVR
jgi:hypothetical protein